MIDWLVDCIICLASARDRLINQLYHLFGHSSSHTHTDMEHMSKRWFLGETYHKYRYKLVSYPWPGGLQSNDLTTLLLEYPPLIDFRKIFANIFNVWSRQKLMDTRQPTNEMRTLKWRENNILFQRIYCIKHRIITVEIIIFKSGTRHVLFYYSLLQELPDTLIYGTKQQIFLSFW